MKRKLFAILLVAVLAVPTVMAIAGNEGTGNGARSGRHYTLNLLGKDWEHGDTVKEDGGHRIFVRLGAQGDMKRTKIQLMEGTDFAVLDSDGTDGKAKFQLPPPEITVDDKGTPDPSDDEVISSAYIIYIRILGKPQGQADMYSVYVEADGTEWISGEVITLRQEGGKVNRKSPPKFVDVTKELTTIYVDFDGDGAKERISLFDSRFEEFFWYYDNQGLKHVQIRFYPVE